MAALDNLLPASYNGIDFYVETDSIQTGKSEIEIERDKAFARLKKRLAENQRS